MEPSAPAERFPFPADSLVCIHGVFLLHLGIAEYYGVAWQTAPRPTIMRFSVRFIVKGKFWFVAAWVIVAQVGCSHPATEQEPILSLNLMSSSLSGDAIPDKYTCGGEDISPQLSWKTPPARTQSFVLAVTDKDSTLGSWVGYFVHWVLYDLPADKRELPEGVPRPEQLPDGSRQGRNDFDEVGYGGPCPPGKSSHRYSFVLYALDARLNLPGGATEKQIRRAMNGHILAKGELIGRYQR
jgi:Raf kinase inhibitor-like YbhB/YbcL family protein